MNPSLFRKVQWTGYLLIAACALLLCWKGVSWALRPGLFLWADEIGNLPWLLATPYHALLHFLPLQIYNDRPTGDVLERVLYELFGFDYRRQLACFLCFHFANCVLVFVLFRRVGVSPALSLAGAGLFGSLNTTAVTATYIGASFDVLCTFFLLGSLLAGLGKSWPYWYASALLFLLALRSKEFAIVTPVLLALLLLCRDRRAPWRRLGPHYAILLIVGLRYLSFVPRMRVEMSTQHPYYLDTSLVTIWKSLSYYTALIFTLEDRGPLPTLLLAALAVIVLYALVRRRAIILFAFAAYVLTLLPMAMLRNIRQPLYDYCPQIFLILAIALFFSELKPPAVTFALAAALLAAGYAIRSSDYFNQRIAFFHDVRATCARTAAQASAHLSGIPPGAHLYIASGASIPWLFTSGPCAYLKLWRHDRNLSCVILKPENELLDLYNHDPGSPAARYFIDYHPDGSLQIRLPAAR